MPIGAPQSTLGVSTPHDGGIESVTLSSVSAPTARDGLGRKRERDRACRRCERGEDAPAERSVRRDLDVESRNEIERPESRYIVGDPLRVRIEHRISVHRQEPPSGRMLRRRNERDGGLGCIELPAGLVAADVREAADGDRSRHARCTDALVLRLEGPARRHPTRVSPSSTGAQPLGARGRRGRAAGRV